MVTKVDGGLPTLAQCWEANQSPEMVGEWLEYGWPADILPTQCQRWVNVGKLTIN